MPAKRPTQAILEYRVAQLEATVTQDHEVRIRKLEGMAAKVAVFAAGGSFVGGAVVVALVNFFIN
jgi:formate/nitrite transporter FocA (FNT family)